MRDVARISSHFCWQLIDWVYPSGGCRPVSSVKETQCQRIVNSNESLILNDLFAFSSASQLKFFSSFSQNLFKWFSFLFSIVQVGIIFLPYPSLSNLAPVLMTNNESNVFWISPPLLFLWLSVISTSMQLKRKFCIINYQISNQ